MNFSAKLLKNYDHGFATLIRNNDGEYCLFSTKDSNGRLRASGWDTSEESAIKYCGEYSGMSPEDIDRIAKERDWQIVRPIHCTELFGKKKCEPGEKVRLHPEAERMCGETALNWLGGMQKMVEDGYGFFYKMNGSDYRVWDKDKNDYRVFPTQAVLPWYDEDETVEMTVEEISKALGKKVKVVEG